MSKSQFSMDPNVKKVCDNLFKSFRIWCNVIWLHFVGMKWPIREVFTKHKPFDIAEIAPRPGQVAVITGGARGLGLNVIEKLLQCQMDVIMGCRDIEAGRRAINAIRQSGITTGTVECWPLDLMSFMSVRTFAEEIITRKKSIHVLINNAGVMAVPYQLSKDENETQLQVNHFGHFLLTNLLIPKMIETSQSEKIIPRIVNVSSVALFHGQVFYDDFSKRHYYDRYQTYSDSKLFILTAANYLDKKLKEEGHNISVYTLHPGIINTNLWNSSPLHVRWVMSGISSIFRSIAEGAEDITYAVLSPEIKNDSGIFLVNNTKFRIPSDAENKAVQEKVWEISCKVVGLQPQTLFSSYKNAHHKTLLAMG